MKEILFSPEFIQQERERLEKENDGELEILQELIKIYGSRSVANYLNWHGERLIAEENRES